MVAGALAGTLLMLFSGASTGFVVGMEAIRRLTKHRSRPVTIMMVACGLPMITS